MGARTRQAALYACCTGLQGETRPVVVRHVRAGKAWSRTHASCRHRGVWGCADGRRMLVMGGMRRIGGSGLAR
eukprot:scaffold6494_cov129-Isochrysis_galbana.AAC.4